MNDEKLQFTEVKNEDKIIEIINQLRPYLNSEGGDIEYVKYEDDYVFVKLYGACANCSYQDLTLENNIYEAIKCEIPSVKGVINIEI